MSADPALSATSQPDTPPDAVWDLTGPNAEPVRVLMNYLYLSKHRDVTERLERLFAEHPNTDLFIDSGAFTASRSGNPIDVHEYGRWMQQHGHWGAVISSLDVIGAGDDSAELTWRNHRVLVDEYGLDPLPVVHIGESWDVLDRYLDLGHDYIALGGLVGKPWRRVAAPWCIEAFKRVGSNAVLHGFGMTNRRGMFDLPWFSIDSSSWTQPARFAEATLFDPKTRTTRLFWLSTASSLNKDFNRICRTYGFDPAMVRNPTGAAELQVKLTAVASRSLERHLQRRFGLIPRPKHPDETGLRIYLVCTDPNRYINARDAINDRYNRQEPQQWIT